MQNGYQKFALLFFLLMTPIFVSAHICSRSIDKNPQSRCNVSAVQSVWYIDGNLGRMYQQKIGTFYLMHPQPDEFLPDKYDAPTLQSVDLAGFSIGRLWSRSESVLPFVSLGLEYTRHFSGKIMGLIEDYSDSSEGNFYYHYQLAHHNVHLIAKANLFCWRAWMPYVSAGVGMSWNQLSSYDEYRRSLLSYEHVNPYFTNKLTSSLSYSLGAGIDYQLTKHLWSGVGYRYDNFGQFASGESNQKFVEGQSLKDHVRGHNIFFSLRYLFH